jgi:hypothetical protein
MPDLLKSRRMARSSAAAQMWRVKKLLGLHGKDWKLSLFLYKRGHYVPAERPTAAGLLAEARELLESSKAPGAAIQSEYYSFCGLEDAAYERRKEHGREAVFVYEAALLLGAPKDEELEAATEAHYENAVREFAESFA